MKHCIRAMALAVALSPGVVLAQGNDATTAGAAAESDEDARGVQVGAGTLSDVTTGSSGPGSDDNPTIPPGPALFSITPQQHPFYGPGMLPVEAPRRLQCELIGDANARKACETRAKHAAAGGPDG